MPSVPVLVAVGVLAIGVMAYGTYLLKFKPVKTDILSTDWDQTLSPDAPSLGAKSEEQLPSALQQEDKDLVAIAEKLSGPEGIPDDVPAENKPPAAPPMGDTEGKQLTKQDWDVERKEMQMEMQAEKKEEELEAKGDEKAGEYAQAESRESDTQSTAMAAEDVKVKGAESAPSGGTTVDNRTSSSK